jgi:hypothetical protein
MAGPNLVQYLEIRRNELEAQRSNILGFLKPVEEELAQVRKIRALLADAVQAGLADFASNVELPIPPEMMDRGAKATIKDMILAALTRHFNIGASPTDLRDYILTTFGRDIDRNSIGPQLSRLREEGMVDMLSDGKWKLSQNGKWHSPQILRRRRRSHAARTKIS